MAQALIVFGGVFVGLFLVWRLWIFFRDPVRRSPPGPHVLAPADGFIVYVHPVERGEVPIAIKTRRRIPLTELNGLAPPVAGGLLIGTFMSAFDVHVNRAPIAGRITLATTRKGTRNRTMARMLTNLLLGRRPYEQDCNHLIENERHTILIEGDDLTVGVTQIADVWASVIECRVGEGDHVDCGSRYGRIRMGSQVDVFIPDATRVEVVCRPGQRVRAGESVLATIRPPANPISE